jgi:two-component system, NtrC family, response regulator AtoC
MNEQTRILVVDDDQDIGMVLESQLAQAGYDALHVASGAAALEELERRPQDAVITDLRMPGMDGMELLTEIKRRWPELPVVMLTAYGTVELAVEAMRLGAAEFLHKPFEDNEITYVLNKVLRCARLAPPPSLLADCGIIAESAPMKEVERLISRAADSSATVLVQGESGTGKELVVEAIHRASARADQPLIKVHCAAVPEELIEASLFGHDKGAFSGAVGAKPGSLELADGGTLFLDEIGDVPLGIQVKLLRVLAGQEFTRLGGIRPLKVDVRFVTATHRDLTAMVSEGTFREDLFFRLNVLRIDLPPLRDRGEDVAVLAEHFRVEAGRADGRQAPRLEPAGLDLLRAHAWRGNVRELQNVIERLVLYTDGPLITATDVARQLAQVPVFPSEPLPIPEAPEMIAPQEVDPAVMDQLLNVEATSTLGAWTAAAEKWFLVQALQRCGDNKTRAAKVVGVSRRAFYNKLERHGLIKRAE